MQREEKRREENMNGKLSRTAAAISLLCVGRIEKEEEEEEEDITV